MPGPEVKNWDQYEALRKKGFSKEAAARITNYQERLKKHKGKDKKDREEEKNDKRESG